MRDQLISSLERLNEKSKSDLTTLKVSVKDNNKQIKVFKNRYELSYLKVLNNLPEWKRNEIIEVQKTNQLDNRHYDEFIKDVIELAESNKPIFLTTT